MSTPTLQSVSTRLSALDGINAAVPSQASVPVIQADLNGLHTTISQLTLTIQAQLNQFSEDLAVVQAALAGQVVDQTLRLGPLTIPATSFQGPYSINFTNSYADGNYTVEVTGSVGEPMATAGCFVSGVQKQPTPGNGVQVWITNSDSIQHTVTFNVFVRHD